MDFHYYVHLSCNSPFPCRPTTNEEIYLKLKQTIFFFSIYCCYFVYLTNSDMDGLTGCQWFKNTISNNSHSFLNEMNSILIMDDCHHSNISNTDTTHLTCFHFVAKQFCYVSKFRVLRLISMKIAGFA